MSAPAADDEIGMMSAVSSEGDAVPAKAAAKGGRGKAAGKDREAAAAGGEGEENEGGSNSGEGESSDGSSDSSDEEEVRGEEDISGVVLTRSKFLCGAALEKSGRRGKGPSVPLVPAASRIPRGEGGNC